MARRNTWHLRWRIAHLVLFEARISDLLWGNQQGLLRLRVAWDASFFEESIVFIFFTPRRRRRPPPWCQRKAPLPLSSSARTGSCTKPPGGETGNGGTQLSYQPVQELCSSSSPSFAYRFSLEFLLGRGQTYHSAARFISCRSRGHPAFEWAAVYIVRGDGG